MNGHILLLEFMEERPLLLGEGGEVCCPGVLRSVSPCLAHCCGSKHSGYLQSCSSNLLLGKGGL